MERTIDGSPVLDCVEGVLVADVIHEQEAHGSSVVRRGDGAVALLPRRVLRAKHTHMFVHYAFNLTKRNRDCL